MTTTNAKRAITRHIIDREALRSVLIGVRVTYAEDDWITQQAKELGITRPDVCREALKHYRASVERSVRAAEKNIEGEVDDASTSDGNRIG